MVAWTSRVCSAVRVQVGAGGDWTGLRWGFLQESVEVGEHGEGAESVWKEVTTMSHGI